MLIKINYLYVSLLTYLIKNIYNILIMRIYLDVCCYNRPFDDQTQEKIHLETEAVLIILSNISLKNWELVGSDIIDFEISKIPDLERKKK